MSKFAGTVSMSDRTLVEKETEPHDRMNIFPRPAGLFFVTQSDFTVNPNTHRIVLNERALVDRVLELSSHLDDALIRIRNLEGQVHNLQHRSNHAANR